jgi:hypothetical protein
MQKALSLFEKVPLASVAGEGFEPSTSGYEPYDASLRRLKESLAGAVTSADGTDHVAVGRLRLPRLTRFHRNRFTEQPLDLRFLHPSLSSSWLLSSGRDHVTVRRTATITRDPAASRPGPQGGASDQGPEAARRSE